MKPRCKTDFGIAIKALRKSRGLTLEKLSRQAGLCQALLGRLENGQATISEKAFLTITEFYGLSERETLKLFRVIPRSQPSVKINMNGLDKRARSFVLLLSKKINRLSPKAITRMGAILLEG